MNGFDYDAMQKKRIAAGDRHRKRPGRKCSLPSDNLTEAQIRRMNGPVRTYQMDRPMSWREFKEMPEDLRKQYLVHLREAYTATNELLADMFQVSLGTIQREQTRLGITATHPHLDRGSALERTRRWNAFLHGKEVQPGSTVEGQSDPHACDEPEAPAPLEIAQISATFTGTFRPESLASWLAAFPIQGTPEVRVRVEVELL